MSLAKFVTAFHYMLLLRVTNAMTTPNCYGQQRRLLVIKNLLKASDHVAPKIVTCYSFTHRFPPSFYSKNVTRVAQIHPFPSLAALGGAFCERVHKNSRALLSCSLSCPSLYYTLVLELP